MNTNRFIVLLENFFNRTTSLEEDRFLCELLISGDYPSGFSEEVELALYYFLEEMKSWSDHPDQKKEIVRIQIAYDCVRFNKITRRKRLKRGSWPPIPDQASMAIRGFLLSRF